MTWHPDEPLIISGRVVADGKRDDVLRALAQHSTVPIVTSLGVGAHLEAWGLPAERITELDWWQTHRLPGLEVEVTAADLAADEVHEHDHDHDHDHEDGEHEHDPEEIAAADAPADEPESADEVEAGAELSEPEPN